MSPREVLEMATRLAVEAGADPVKARERMSQLAMALVDDAPEHCADCNASDEVCDAHAPKYVRDQRAYARMRAEH